MAARANEALTMLDDAMKAWVAAKLEDGEPILEPNVENDAIEIRKPHRHVRQGWVDASRALASAGDDKLIWPEFANEQDRDLTW